MNMSVIGIGAIAAFVLAGFFLLAALVGLRLRSVRNRIIEADACAYAAACVRAEREEFGSYNDREISEAQNFEFYKMFYLESNLEMERA